jgi:hypothetical protein
MPLHGTFPMKKRFPNALVFGLVANENWNYKPDA